MNVIAYWEVEDTLFGAILGAFLGTFIANLSILHITLIVLFFILFPVILRKSDALSRHALMLASFVSLLWIIFFVLDLHNQAMIDLERGTVLVIIFLGWLISTNLRIIYKPK